MSLLRLYGSERSGARCHPNSHAATWRRVFMTPGLILLALLWPSSAASANDGVALRAGARHLVLPTGAVTEMPVKTAWLGLPLQMQRFHVPVSVADLAHRLAKAMPEAPDLLVEPGRAMLAWFEPPVHWSLQLTGRDRVTHGVLSGLTLAAAPGLLPAREAGVPSWAALVHSTDADGPDGRRRLQVYVAQRRLRQEHVMSGLSAAGWKVATSGAGQELLRRGGTVMRVYCLTPEGANACLLLSEASR